MELHRGEVIAGCLQLFAPGLSTLCTFYALVSKQVFELFSQDGHILLKLNVLHLDFYEAFTHVLQLFCALCFASHIHFYVNILLANFARCAGYSCPDWAAGVPTTATRRAKVFLFVQQSTEIKSWVFLHHCKFQASIVFVQESILSFYLL